MNPAPIGTRIQVVANSNNHHYRVGGIYHVHQVDPDGTFKAACEAGVEGDYLKWSDCKPAGIGWEWLRGQLDARTLDLLSAFEGVELLSLRKDVEAQVISAIPDLSGRILQILPEVEQASLALQAAADTQDEELANLFP